MQSLTKLYIGSRRLRPDGFKTVDIDPANEPDFLADLCDMAVVPSGSCCEVIASHILEHIEWPQAFTAFSELVRVLASGGELKVAVPDMASLMTMLAREETVFSVMASVYGGVGLNNRYEQHRFGYTAPMLMDILSVLGMGGFTWWNSTRPEAANGWLYGSDGVRVGTSLNLSAKKAVEVPPSLIQEIKRGLEKRPIADFFSVVAESVGAFAPDHATAPYLYQHIHFQLIDAHQRIKYLEERLSDGEGRLSDGWVTRMKRYLSKC